MKLYIIWVSEFSYFGFIKRDQMLRHRHCKKQDLFDAFQVASSLEPSVDQVLQARSPLLKFPVPLVGDKDSSAPTKYNPTPVLCQRDRVWGEGSVHTERFRDEWRIIFGPRRTVGRRGGGGTDVCGKLKRVVDFRWDYYWCLTILKITYGRGSFPVT